LDLQKLLLHSYSARMIAIPQVTQLNDGKKTAGIDGKLALTNSERLQLERKLFQQSKRWQHQGLPYLCRNRTEKEQCLKFQRLLIEHVNV